MTKAELITRLYGNKKLPRELTKKTLQQIVECLFTEIGDHFIRAKPIRGSLEKFTYPNFGTFSKWRRPGRIVRNPRTMEPMTIPPQFTVTFSPSSSLKSMMNQARPKTAVAGK
jgi:nucleoid DNA-binding protein